MGRNKENEKKYREREEIQRMGKIKRTGRNTENGKKYREWEEIQRMGRNTENGKK